LREDKKVRGGIEKGRIEAGCIRREAQQGYCQKKEAK